MALIQKQFPIVFYLEELEEEQCVCVCVCVCVYGCVSIS